MKFISAFLLLLLLSAPDNSHAAISFDNSTNAVVTNNNSLSWRHNIGIGANRKLIVGIGIEEDDSSGHDVVTGVTYNGVNLTFAGQTSISSTGYLQRVEVWYMDEANLPNGNRWIQVNTTGNVREISAGAISLFDAEQGVPAFQASSSNISQTSISTNITTTVDNSWVVDVVGSGQPFTFAPGAGQTERWDSDQSIGNWTSSAASSTKIVTTAGVTTMTQNQNSNRMAHVVLAIKPFGVAPPVLPAVVGEWRMDELSWNGSAGEVIDSSVNGLNGVRAGSATPTAAKLCNGATLNGTTDYVEIADNALLDISDELTVTAWIKPDAIPGSGLKTIISKDENFEFHLTNTAEINWWWNNSAGATRSITTSGASITAGNWYHVAIVYSQTGGSQKIYINGIERASATYSEALRLNNDPLQIGADQGAAGRQFDGQIDEVRIYASMLTAGNVAQVMAETRTCPGVTTPTPIVLSTAGTATLGGTTFENEDAVAFTSTATTIPFDGSTIFAGNENIDAFHFIDSDNVLLSTTGNASIGTTSFRDEDVVQYTFSTGVATIIFDGSTIFSGNEDIDAVYQIDADTILISTMEPAAIGGNNYQDNVMIQYTLSTGANSEFFDLEDYTTGGSDIDGFHIHPNGNYLISTDDTETIASLTFEDEDVIELDIGAPSVTLYFEGDANYSADEETDAVSLIVPTITLDHFAINYLTGASGTGVNCQAEALTIEAHDASHNLITTYTGTVTLGASTANGDWSKTGTASDAFGTLTAGASDSGTATYTFNATDSGSIILNFKDTHTEIVNLNTVDSLISETSNSAVANDDYQIDFAATGFNFLATTPPSTTAIKNTIGTQISGKPSNIAPSIQSLELQAIKTSDETGACEAAFTGATPIEIAFECIDPLSCTGDKLFISADGGTTFDQMDGTPELTYTSITDFDFGNATDTTAPLIIRYDDAGKIKLHARKILTPSTEQMIGASNEFVVRPFAFYTTITGNPAATSPLGAAFTSAGIDFSVNTRAVLWQSADDDGSGGIGVANDGIADGHEIADTDPSNNVNLADNTVANNYGQEITTEQVLLSSLLDQPAGGNDPVLDDSSANGRRITSFTVGTGIGTSTTINYDEVGIIELYTSVNDGIDSNYLGIGLAETAKILGRSGYVGRFTPHHFDTILTDGCTNVLPLVSFTYSGEPITVQTKAMYFSAAPNITQNYTGGFAKNVTLSSTTGVAGSFNGTENILAADFVNGSYIKNDVAYTFTAKESAPDASFTIRATDVEGITSNDPAANEGTTDLRSGRTRIENAFGSELSDLPVPARVEFFNANGFEINTDDTCSTVTAFLTDIGADLILVGTGLAGETCIWDDDAESGADNCTNPAILPGLAISQFEEPPVAGSFNLNLLAPGANNTGDIGITFTSPTWLQFDWDGNGTHDNDPTGVASFGLYRGDDRIIYWREVFE